MIVTRLSGGLGNQMFQYAIARSLAQRNDEIFKLDISFYSKQILRRYELNFFNINENIALESECYELRGSEGLLFKIKKKLNISSFRPDLYVKEKKNTIYAEEIYNIHENCYLDGFWQNEKYFTNIRELLIKDFTLKSEMGREAKKYFSAIKSTNSVSLHIRRGDYISNTHTNNFHGVCNMQYYKRSIEYIVENIDNLSFYIFSDDIAWCKENFNFLQKKTFIDSTKSALEDLMLMKNCKHNIIANSSFSWWGAWLNKNKNKTVIAPDVWWKGKDLSPVPSLWQRL